eukprot:8644165-Prorocentrum_lima.AAC.1
MVASAQTLSPEYDVDCRPAFSMDFTIPLDQRKLAPGYVRLRGGKQELFGTWLCRAPNVPAYEYVGLTAIEVLALLPPTHLTPDGWTARGEQMVRGLIAWACEENSQRTVCVNVDPKGKLRWSNEVSLEKGEPLCIGSPRRSLADGTYAKIFIRPSLSLIHI